MNAPTEKKPWEEQLENLAREFQLHDAILALLHDIDQKLLSETRPDDEFFTRIVTTVQQIFGAGTFRTRILLKRGSQLVHQFSTVPTEVSEVVKAVDSITARCISDGETRRIPDARPFEPAFVQGRPVRHSVLATPLQFRGQRIGVLCAESSEPNAYSTSHEDSLVKVAAQVSLALARRQSVEEAGLLARLDELAFSDDDAATVIRAAMDQIVEELLRQEVRFNGVQILFPKGEELEIVYSTRENDLGIRVPIDRSITGRAVREGRTIIVGDVDQDPSYVRMLGDEIQSEIAVPVMLRYGRLPVAVLNVESDEIDMFDGFYAVSIANFADTLRILFAMTKLRSDVAESLELRATNELMAAVGDQATHMVHRLNNTVGAMRFRLLDLQQSLDDGDIDRAYLAESLEKLLSLAERTLEMPRRVTQLLGNSELKASVNECVREAASGMAPPEGVDVVLELSAEVAQPAPSNFDIVVQNLIQNAFDAMPHGGTLTIETFAEHHETLGITSVNVKISDTGTGIPVWAQPQVWDLAFSTKSATRQGTGLGLWWVRNFVRRAGGEITFSTQEGRGTQFLIRLPVGKATGRES